MVIRNIVLLILTISFSFGVFSQNDSIQEIEKGIWLKPIPPIFPGGDSKMYSFIQLVKNYPGKTKARGIAGKVYIEFVVGKTGVLSNFRIMRSPDTLLSLEAIRIVKLMPNWVPGINHNGDSVGVKMILPIDFIINKESVYTVVEKMPEFSGGYSKMLEYLNNNIKIPQSYFDNGVIGKFFFEFVVEKDGSISKLKLINDDNFKLHKIVASAFINMPKWIPGKQNGEAVRVKMVFPIHIN